ncbi:AI-2E family transporter [Streptomyces badius]
MLQPKLTAKTVDIHPAVAFGSVIAGTALLGAVGALVADPGRRHAPWRSSVPSVKRYDVTDDPRVHGGSSRAARAGRSHVAHELAC